MAPQLAKVAAASGLISFLLRSRQSTVVLGAGSCSQELSLEPAVQPRQQLCQHLMPMSVFCLICFQQEEWILLSATDY